jgi:hypothetical protein
VLWALVFLCYGLVPTILLHAVFDLVLFAIPLFLVDAPGAGVQRALVIAAGLVPLGVIVVRRWRARGWGELAAELRNEAWQPAPPAAPAAAPPASHAGEAAAPRWTALFQRALPALGAAGLAAWVLATPFHANVPPLPIARADAEAAADAAVRTRGIEPGREWRRASAVRVAPDEPGTWLEHKFVWREVGGDAYENLVGSVLLPPSWAVRYARFDGPVADRAEEWWVTVNGDGTVRQVRHALPEGRPGAKLDRDTAAALALRALREHFGIAPDAVTLAGAEERQRPARTDWVFTFAEPRVAVGGDGEARIAITLAGDEIAGYRRFVHVPETWQRAEREREGRVAILRMTLAALLGIGGIAAVIVAVTHWMRGHCNRWSLVAVAAVVFSAGAVELVNGWPLLAMNLNTTEPIVSQVAMAMAAALLLLLVRALSVGLAAGVGAWAAGRPSAQPIAGSLPVWAAGVAAALFAAGVGGALARLAPQAMPHWPTFAIESQSLPVLGALTAAAHVVALVGVGLFALYFLELLTGGWRRRGLLAALLLVAAVTAASFVAAQDPILAAVDGIVTGAATVAIVYGLLRFDPRALPPFLVTGAVLQITESALRKGTATALVHGALAIGVAVVVAWAYGRYLARACRTPEAT